MTARYGEVLYEICGRFRRAGTEIVERVIRIQAIWVRTKSQLAYVRRIAPDLTDEQWIIQEETLKIFANKLDIVATKVGSFLKKSNADESSSEWSVRSSKYAFFGKALDDAIIDLESWQKIFDPSWYLMMQHPKPETDDVLQDLRFQSKLKGLPIERAQSLRIALSPRAQADRSIFLGLDGLNGFNIKSIPYSATEVGLRQENDPGSNVVLDRIVCPSEVNPHDLRRNVRNLARKLAQADPVTFGLLNCKGVIEHPRLPNQAIMYTMVFRVPKEYSRPRSLRCWLLDHQTSHSLSDRFQIADQLAKSVHYVHTFEFVHKNILPETILLFRTPSSIGSPLLVGFGIFRDAEGQTRHSGDDSWEKNIYRHPRRQGIKPEVDYIMQHDIYSLGVCLLEVGLWDSFVEYNQDMTSSPSPMLNYGRDLELRDPFKTKDRLLTLTRELLPTRMGTKYAAIVETCLTCLDDDNVEFGDEDKFTDIDGVKVGKKYIEKVRLIHFDP